MEAAHKKSVPTRKARVAKRATPKGKPTGSREGRRLVRLLVSVVLFLAVFAGRGVFRGEIQVWGELIRSDADFGAAFQGFGQALADEKGLVGALKVLGTAMLGGEVEEQQQEQEDSQSTRPEFVPLKETGKFGLERASDYGVMKVFQMNRKEEVAEPQPEATPQVVTAVAQTYGENGESLPSNVSFVYYELGLTETAVPVSGTATSGFGYRKSPTNGKKEFHLALDIAAEKGTEIGAFADGVVQYIGESDEFGLYLKINHANNVSTFYAHCSKLLVRKGEKVTCGQTVALVGSTGNATGSHLHLTVEKDGIRLDPSYYVDLS